MAKQDAGMMADIFGGIHASPPPEHELMNLRRVCSTINVDAARTAMSAACASGIVGKRISLIAREDIELKKIPDDRQQPNDDANPSAMRGAACGDATGLLLGLVADAAPPLGVTLGCAVAATAAGTVFGS
jgi:hypothetical protein